MGGAGVNLQMPNDRLAIARPPGANANCSDLPGGGLRAAGREGLWGAPGVALLYGGIAQDFSSFSMKEKRRQRNVGH